MSPVNNPGKFELSRPMNEEEMLEFNESVAVLDQEFFAESGDVLPTDVDYDVSDDGASNDFSFLSDGEGGNAPAAY